MAKPTTFRFAIADDKPLSECWSVFTNQNDVYLTSNTQKRLLKVSLHQSGVCQVALLEGFFKKHVEWREERPESRTILRWKRLSTPKDRGQVTASILFASDGFWPEGEPIPASKPYTALAPPPQMHGRRVDVVYSLSDPKHVAKLGEWTDKLLFSTQLPNGEFIGLMQFVEPLAEDFFAFSPMTSAFGISLGIEENEIDDVRGISFLDCTQLFEGHCLIRSLHNMRLIKVQKGK